MGSVSTRVQRSLERWNAGAFLVAGVLAAGYAVLKGLKAYGGLEVITVYDVLYGGFVLLAPVVALLGLSPRLREAAPRLSIGAVVAAAIAGVATVAIMLQLVITTLSVQGYPEIPGDGPAWPAVALVLTFVALALGFLLSGAAARRAEDVSRTVAWLLVVPFVMWIGLIAANVVLPSGDYLGLYAYAPISVALLAIGYQLRMAGVSTDRTEPASETVAE